MLCTRVLGKTKDLGFSRKANSSSQQRFKNSQLLIFENQRASCQTIPASSRSFRGVPFRAAIGLSPRCVIAANKIQRSPWANSTSVFRPIMRHSLLRLYMRHDDCSRVEDNKGLGRGCSNREAPAQTDYMFSPYDHRPCSHFALYEPISHICFWLLYFNFCRTIQVCS